MTLRLTWLLLNLVAFLSSILGLGFAIYDIFNIYAKNLNGERRRTTLKHLTVFFTFNFTSIAFLLLSIDAFLQPHQPRTTLLFSFGVAAILFVSINITFASLYSLLQRAEDFRVAKQHDTDGKKYEEAKKNQGTQVLKPRYGC